MKGDEFKRQVVDTVALQTRLSLSVGQQVTASTEPRICNPFKVLKLCVATCKHLIVIKDVE